MASYIRSLIKFAKKSKGLTTFFLTLCFFLGGLSCGNPEPLSHTGWPYPYPPGTAPNFIFSTACSSGELRIKRQHLSTDGHAATGGQNAHHLQPGEGITIEGTIYNSWCHKSPISFSCSTQVDTAQEDVSAVKNFTCHTGMVTTGPLNAATWHVGGTIPLTHTVPFESAEFVIFSNNRFKVDIKFGPTFNFPSELNLPSGCGIVYGCQ